MMSERGVTKQREGVVRTDRMAKTVVVELERIVLHARYKKYLRRRTRVKAHDERDECRVGDRVLITECRPLSREKRWRVSRVLNRAVTGAAAD
ncbi:MAG: 30S ribosomal protein S17 [Deltaproteobacteria bacterium]|nr:30S ribosomal protein S17 [Deltaproteobacteria bacterium]MDE0213222.1 30S ribosomal protein S17 [Deltaproteobacteria bacterium]